MRKPTRALVTAAALALVVLGATACSMTPSAQQNENQQAQVGLQEVVRNQPVPAFAYSQDRQNLIEIETAIAKGIQTTSFFFQQGDPDPVRSCPSIGYPKANTTSLTNPLQVVGGPQSGNVTVEQMDPTGVYTPSSSSGTYVMCVAPDGSGQLAYWEGNVEAEAGLAKWDVATRSIQILKPADFHFSTAQGK